MSIESESRRIFNESHSEVLRLRAENTQLRAELNEEAVLNGKGSEREAALLAKVERLERENAELRERLHIADAEIDMWASRCASAIWLLPETVTGGQLREAQDKFHRMLHAARKEAKS